MPTLNSRGFLLTKSNLKQQYMHPRPETFKSIKSLVSWIWHSTLLLQIRNQNKLSTNITINTPTLIRSIELPQQQSWITVKDVFHSSKPLRRSNRLTHKLRVSYMHGTKNTIQGWARNTNIWDAVLQSIKTSANDLERDCILKGFCKTELKPHFL